MMNTETLIDVRAEVIATLASAATRSGLTHYEDRGRVAVPLLTPEDVYRALGAHGLLATDRPEPSDAQVKRAAAALMDGDPEYANGTYGPDDYEAMARAALTAARTEAD